MMKSSPKHAKRINCSTPKSPMKAFVVEDLTEFNSSMDLDVVSFIDLMLNKVSSNIAD